MSKRLKTPALILAHSFHLLGKTSHNVHISPQPQFCCDSKSSIVDTASSCALREKHWIQRNPKPSDYHSVQSDQILIIMIILFAMLPGMALFCSLQRNLFQSAEFKSVLWDILGSLDKTFFWILKWRTEPLLENKRKYGFLILVLVPNMLTEISGMLRSEVVRKMLLSELLHLPTLYSVLCLNSLKSYCGWSFFWHVMQCHQVYGSQCFERPLCLQLTWSKQSKQNYCIYPVIQHHIPENLNPQQDDCEKLQSELLWHL